MKHDNYQNCVVWKLGLHKLLAFRCTVLRAPFIFKNIRYILTVTSALWDTLIYPCTFYAGKIILKMSTTAQLMRPKNQTARVRILTLPICTRETGTQVTLNHIILPLWLSVQLLKNLES